MTHELGTSDVGQQRLERAEGRIAEALARKVAETNKSITSPPAAEAPSVGVPPDQLPAELQPEDDRNQPMEGADPQPQESAQHDEDVEMPTASPLPAVTTRNP